MRRIRVTRDMAWTLNVFLLVVAVFAAVFIVSRPDGAPKPTEVSTETPTTVAAGPSTTGTTVGLSPLPTSPFVTAPPTTGRATPARPSSGGVPAQSGDFAWASALLVVGTDGSFSAVSPDGSTVRQLFRRADATAATWSPDRTRVAYSAPDGVHVANRDGGSDNLLGPGFTPRWTPDGRALAYACPSGEHGSHHVCVISADGSARKDLTPNEPGYADSPDWSPDGSRLVFRTRHGLESMAYDGSDRKMLLANLNEADKAEFFVSPRWSPTGPTIAFVRKPGDSTFYDIWTMASDGTGLALLRRTEEDEYSPAWSPDGSKLAFIRSRTVGGALSSILELLGANGDGGATVLDGQADRFASSVDW